MTSYNEEQGHNRYCGGCPDCPEAHRSERKWVERAKSAEASRDRMRGAAQRAAGVLTGIIDTEPGENGEGKDRQIAVNAHAELDAAITAEAGGRECKGDGCSGCDGCLVPPDSPPESSGVCPTCGSLSPAWDETGPTVLSGRAVRHSEAERPCPDSFHEGR